MSVVKILQFLFVKCRLSNLQHEVQEKKDFSLISNNLVKFLQTKKNYAATDCLIILFFLLANQLRQHTNGLISNFMANDAIHDLEFDIKSQCRLDFNLV